MLTKPAVIHSKHQSSKSAPTSMKTRPTTVLQTARTYWSLDSTRKVNHKYRNLRHTYTNSLISLIISRVQFARISGIVTKESMKIHLVTISLRVSRRRFYRWSRQLVLLIILQWMISNKKRSRPQTRVRSRSIASMMDPALHWIRIWSSYLNQIRMNETKYYEEHNYDDITEFNDKDKIVCK